MGFGAGIGVVPGADSGAELALLFCEAPAGAGRPGPLNLIMIRGRVTVMRDPFDLGIDEAVVAFNAGASEVVSSSTEVEGGAVPLEVARLLLVLCKGGGDHDRRWYIIHIWVK